jgi:undecaprenyl-diphosphatase
VPVSLPNTDAFDDAVDGLFEPLRGNLVADQLFYSASKAAEFSIGWHALSIIGATFFPPLRPHAVRMTVALGIESILVNGMIKPIFDRRRPSLVAGEPHLRRPKTSSFPSGHASSASMAAVLLTDAMPTLRPVWTIAAGVVGASRVHARMHHGSDVAAGFVVGTVLGVITRRLYPLR